MKWVIAAFLLVGVLPQMGVANQDGTRDPDDEEQHHAATVDGFLGNYQGGRDGSGTSWQPSATPMEGFHFRSGEWSFMAHGFLNFVRQKESEPRGATESYSTNWGMISAQRALGRGRVGFRFMTSLEPILGREGYPLLLQTGETADGINPLFDRQHPHDVLMEVALTYRRPVGDDDSIFIYLAPVGEPALGPTAFMHRFSGSDNPVAPLTHHWLDSTHIAYGVLTFGWIRANKVKVDASIFNGREPDENRWDVDPIRLNSFSLRFTSNPSPEVSFHLSLGALDEPEQLHQGVDLVRMSASVSYNRQLHRGNWQSTLAWGRNKRHAVFLDAPEMTTAPSTGHVHFTPDSFPLSPTVVQHALLAETGLRHHEAHSMFARFEWAEKDDLFSPDDPRHAAIFDVSKLSFGYVFDLVRVGGLRMGLGGYASLHRLSRELASVYGEKPTSYGAFLRIKVQ